MQHARPVRPLTCTAPMLGASCDTPGFPVLMMLVVFVCMAAVIQGRVDRNLSGT